MKVYFEECLMVLLYVKVIFYFMILNLLLIF